MEVMGLMLGEFVDDYTVRVVDVFAMPQARAGRGGEGGSGNAWEKSLGLNAAAFAGEPLPPTFLCPGPGPLPPPPSPSRPRVEQA